MSRISVTVALLTAVTLSSACTNAEPSVEAARQEADPSIHDPFVGTWALVSFVSFREDGEVVDNDYVGRLTYDAFGNMTGVGMPRSLPGRVEEGSTDIPRAGFGYFSTYEVHPEDHRVIHHVVGSPMNPAWVGTDLVRFYELTGDRLALSLRNPDGRVTGTLTWRRLATASND